MLERIFGRYDAEPRPEYEQLRRDVEESVTAVFDVWEQALDQPLSRPFVVLDASLRGTASHKGLNNRLAINPAHLQMRIRDLPPQVRAAFLLLIASHEVGHGIARQAGVD